MPQICGEGRSRDWTSTPSRYHPGSVFTAFVCLRSCNLGGNGASAPTPGVLAETSGCGLRCAGVESCSAQRHEEARVAWMRAELVAPARVSLERLQDRRVQGYVARLVELCCAAIYVALGSWGCEKRHGSGVAVAR